MKVISILLITLINSSCSFKSLIVSNLDYLMTDKISDELNLNDEQEDELRVEIKTFLNENKKSAEELKKKISQLDIDKTIPIEGLKKQYIEIAKRLIPILSKYYFKLSVEQKSAFFKYQEEKNKEVKADMEKMDTKSVSRKYEAFLGYINDRQRGLIKESLPLLKQLSQKRIARRKEIQKALKNAKSFEKVSEAFGIFTSSLNKTDVLYDNFYVFMSKMIATTNEDQKKTLKEKKIELVQILEYYITNTY